MTVQFEIPNHIEEILRSIGGDASQAAKEAAMVELYRRGSLSHHELAESLGISRMATDGMLKRHGVTEDLLTSEEIAADIKRLRRLVP